MSAGDVSPRDLEPAAIDPVARTAGSGRRPGRLRNWFTRPRAVGVAENPQPVAVAVRLLAGYQRAPDPLDLDGAHGEVATGRRVGGPEQVDREGMLGVGEVLHRQAGSVPWQVTPLPQVRIGKLAADQAALPLVKAREQRASTPGTVTNEGRHALKQSTRRFRVNFTWPICR